MNHHMRHLVGVLGTLLALLLTGCGGSTSTSTTAPGLPSAPPSSPPAAMSAPEALPPEAVHQQYLKAMFDNDRQKVLDLSVEEWKPSALSQLKGIQGFLTGDTTATDLGAFQDFTIGPLTDQGKTKVGRSVWRYKHKQQCWETTLAQSSSGWRVASSYIKKTCGA
jgi:hypothetical protein